ncbi:DEAD/DEAH box helicase family protein [Chloroflexota bacterium]
MEQDTLSALAWMVADDILDFCLALPRNKLDNEFHAKFGIFSDAYGNQIAFNGSYNDSITGIRNYEEIDIFCSWVEGEVDWVERRERQFQRLWDNEDKNVRVLELPEAAREKIIKLRSEERPYPEPDWVKERRIFETGTDYEPTSLWKHQQEAIAAWEQNNRVGLLSMATGSGKTRTAIAAAKRCPSLNLLIIAVPRKNLVEQWAGELSVHASFPDPILVYESSAKWQDRLFNKLRAAHEARWSKPVVIIGSLQSLSRKRFISVINDAGIPQNTLLVVDEVHNVGAPTYRKILDLAYQWRLGLSATPVRHFDEIGSATINDYFLEVVYVYGLKQALEDKHLSPYAYKVYAAELSLEEYDQYMSLTYRIISLRGRSEDDAVTFQTNNVLDGDDEEIEQLLFKRARILKKCMAKMEITKDILAEGPPSRCLIYCADHEQLDDVQQILNDSKIIHLKYTGKTSASQRKAALDALDSGQISILLAIDCLDEGVDVPSVDTAIILASSTNKRQFIQRRGRILRRAKGKQIATLIDVIVLPPQSVGREGKWMLNGELARAKEMAELAQNKYDALLQIKAYTEPYDVLLTELLSGEGDR